MSLHDYWDWRGPGVISRENIFKILVGRWCILDTDVIDFYIIFCDRSVHYVLLQIKPGGPFMHLRCVSVSVSAALANRFYTVVV